MGTVHGVRWNGNRESGSQSSVHRVLVMPDRQLRILWRVLSNNNNNNNNNNNSGNSLSITNNNIGEKDDILTHYIAPYIDTVWTTPLPFQAGQSILYKRTK